MTFVPDNKNRVEFKLAENVIEYGTYIGRSLIVNDYYWACYQYDEKFYISLNDSTNSWEVTEEDIDNCCVVPRLTGA